MARRPHRDTAARPLRATAARPLKDTGCRHRKDTHLNRPMAHRLLVGVRVLRRLRAVIHHMGGNRANGAMEAIDTKQP